MRLPSVWNTGINLGKRNQNPETRRQKLRFFILFWPSPPEVLWVPLVDFYFLPELDIFLAIGFHSAP